MEEEKFKCFSCFVIFPKSEMVDDCCPGCGEAKMIKKMCELDRCGCEHDITGTVKFCEKCGQPVCPVCNCHDVSQVSRVTGYLSDVAGWNNSKRAELKDRHRENIG